MCIYVCVYVCIYTYIEREIYTLSSKPELEQAASEPWLLLLTDKTHRNKSIKQHANMCIVSITPI